MLSSTTIFILLCNLVDVMLPPNTLLCHLILFKKSLSDYLFPTLIIYWLLLILIFDATAIGSCIIDNVFTTLYKIEPKWM